MTTEQPLLELQRLDSSADALRVRRAELPERAALAAHGAEIAAIASERDAALLRQVALGREERRVETLVTDLRAKAKEVETTLYSGKVKASRELEALQLELHDFQRRQAEREGEELDVMAQVEELDTELAAMAARRETLETEMSALRGALAAAEAKIDAELAQLAEKRATVVPKLPAELTTLYEKLRTFPKLAGRVAVLFDRGACTGCKGALPIMVVSRIQREPAGASIQCPQCQRLLVP
jgi:predicted  nucleic acid-binding Zn-ribbon protein